MANLSTKIRLYLGREVDFYREVVLQDDMVDGVSNQYIKEWNISGEKAQPTDEQLTALESQANDEVAASKIIGKRKMEYPVTEEFIEAYTEKEIDGDSTKWDAYVVKRNKVRSDNPK